MVNAFCGGLLSLCDVTTGSVLLSFTILAHDQSFCVPCHLVAFFTTCYVYMLS